MPITVEDLVGSADAVMGVKAVFGQMSSHVLCFGGRGEKSSSAYYSLPAGIARRGIVSPWVICIGGGKDVRDGLSGRVVNIVRVSATYGATSFFVDEAEAERLARWPVSIAVHDVWQFDDKPHLVSDLGLPNRLILAGSQDGVIRPKDHFPAFWEAVSKRQVSLSNLPCPPNFFDSLVPQLVGKHLPKLPGGSGSEEGKKIFENQLTVERDRKLAGLAKDLNIQKYGQPTCEACRFSHSDRSMFDAHHPYPLALGVRTTLAEHLIVLCPTCHRRAHRKDRLDPYTLAELVAWNASGRP